MTTVGDVLAIALEHHQAGRVQEAAQIYRQVLSVSPQNTDALHLLGLVAMQAGHLEAALDLVGRAVALRGDAAPYQNNFGEVLRRLGRWEEAEEAYQRALAIDPNFADAHNNLGTVYQQRGDLHRALACFERAIACDHDKFNAHYNRARAWLALGDFERGWPEYEWRWRRPEFARQQIDVPAWDGSPLAGRTLLVRWEQGLGDTLQFVRYVKVLTDAGEKVVASVQRELVALLAQSGFKNLVSEGDPLPACDAQAMLLSLPYLMHTTLETIPAPIPYLSADSRLVEPWRARLATTAGRCKVGICWQGNPRSPHEPYRSMPLVQFEPLARVEGVQLVSLQKGFGSEQVAAVANRFAVVDWTAEMDAGGDAFLDTAALASGLDLIVTSDTAIAHLAGALGCQVWVALPHSADARWLVDRGDCPWYPTMRLFRQRRAGDWAGVFEEIRSALVEWVEKKAGRFTAEGAENAEEKNSRKD
jgi:predicted TPR repeat methyltransferase